LTLVFPLAGIAEVVEQNIYYGPILQGAQYAFAELGCSVQFWKSGWHQAPEPRHIEMVNVTFCDGHTKALPMEKVYGVRCAPADQRVTTPLCRDLALDPNSPAYAELWRMWK
jgi:prepilin-type processing-associated H-X9-DG protein